MHTPSQEEKNMLEGMNEGDFVCTSLTDDVKKSWKELDCPVNLGTSGPFSTEADALDWQNVMCSLGYRKNLSNTGWKYGIYYQVASPKVLSTKP
jgi:hypothetical protein